MITPETNDCDWVNNLHCVCPYCQERDAVREIHRNAYNPPIQQSIKPEDRQPNIISLYSYKEETSKVGEVCNKARKALANFFMNVSEFIDVEEKDNDQTIPRVSG